jgi:5-aminopentanamidase
MPGVVRIGACQTPEILGDVDAGVRCIRGFCEQAEPEGADLLLFPECFLQGYLITDAHARRHAFDLGSASFRSVAAWLADVTPVLVVGVIERSGGRLYNSAVVLEHGQVAGVYRKTHLVPGEMIFDKGDEYPVFEVRGRPLGIRESRPQGRLTGLLGQCGSRSLSDPQPMGAPGGPWRAGGAIR